MLIISCMIRVLVPQYYDIWKKILLCGKQIVLILLFTEEAVHHFIMMNNQWYDTPLCDTGTVVSIVDAYYQVPNSQESTASSFLTSDCVQPLTGIDLTGLISACNGLASCLPMSFNHTTINCEDKDVTPTHLIGIYIYQKGKKNTLILCMLYIYIYTNICFQYILKYKLWKSNSENIKTHLIIFRSCWKQFQT